nr:CvpA family protein [Pseudopedobacter sp.]
MFNYVDLILVLILLLAVYQGYRRGFILGLLDLLALAVSLFAAFYFYLYVATFIDDHLFRIEERWLFPLSFFISLLITRLIIGTAILRLFKIISNKIHQNTLNRTMGLLPGLVKGLFITALFSVIFLFVPLWPDLPQKARESYFANNLSQGVETIDNKIAPDISEQVKQSISKLTIEPESEETVYLNFKVDNPISNEQMENHLLVLVNEERKKAGLNLLEKDLAIRTVARLHSKDMFQKGYFSHINLDNQSPFDRMRAHGIIYRAAGENLALAQTVEIAHLGLMNSPGHRANILNPKFNRIGIGIMDGGIYGIMVTQNFRN